MPRASWRGFLRLSLVSCPIYLSSATTRAKSIRLYQVWQPAQPARTWPRRLQLPACFLPTLDLDPLRATVDQPVPWRRPSARSPPLDSNRRCLALPISTTRRTLRSPAKGEGRRADVVGGSLSVKLLGAQRDADVKAQRFRP